MANRLRANGLVGQWHFGKRRPSGADHEEQPQSWSGWMRPDGGGAEVLPVHAHGRGLSCRRRPALKPLFSRAVRTVAWDAVRGCGCRCRAARLSVPERLPGRKWTCTSSPQSAGGPRAGETGGGSSGSPRCVRIFRIGPGSVMNAMSRMSPPHPRARKRKLLAHPSHEFGPSDPGGVVRSRFVA